MQSGQTDKTLIYARLSVCLSVQEYSLVKLVG